MSSLLLSLLGGFHVEWNGEALTKFESNKVRALLAYLAVEADRPQPRTRIAALLWPDHPESMARTNLRHVIRALRQSLSSQDDAHPLLLTTRQTLQVNPDSTFSVDVTCFGQLLAECQACRHSTLSACPACLARYTEAADLYGGEFLAGFTIQDSDLFEEWVVVHRERLHQQALALFVALSDHYEAQGNYDRAHHFAWRQLELEPWREEAHRQMMRVKARSGQRTAALAQYEACRTVLREELGVEPDAETIALYEQIRQGQLDASATMVAPPAAFSPQAGLVPTPLQDWGEAPLIPYFYGRQREIALLQRWLVEDRCRLVSVLGMGGMGKTSLVTKVAKELVEAFDVVIWRSLLNAPPLSELLPSWLQLLLPSSEIGLPTTVGEQLTLLFAQLSTRRCLIVLDNLESILEPDQAGRYRPGYEAYGQLLSRFGHGAHQSCLIYTSRERPQSVGEMEDDLPAVRSLQLDGLEPEDGWTLLRMRGLRDDSALAAQLVERYSGNPLALKLVSRTIQDLFYGDVAAFIGDELPIFDDIRIVLEQQFTRLTSLEQELLIALAIAREAVSVQELMKSLLSIHSIHHLIETLRALQRRSLLEKTDGGFTLQNVVTEYVTDFIVKQVGAEVVQGSAELLNRHALLKTQAKEYIRQSQVRLFLKPIATYLEATLGRYTLEETLRTLLDRLRTEAPLAPGYAAGNILNLLLHLDNDLGGYDFSRLVIRQAFLRGATVSDVDFTGAELTDCAFTDTFGFIYAVACSPDGRLLAVYTGTGEIHLRYVDNGQLYGICRAPRKTGYTIAFSPDGQLLVGGGEDSNIYVWEVQNCQLVSQQEGHTGAVRSVSFSPDGRLLASGSDDCTVRIWTVDDLKSFGQTGNRSAVIVHPDWVCAVAFSPDSRWLASGGTDKSIHLWDVSRVLKSAENPLRHRWQSHTGDVRSLAFSADGKLLASGSVDKSVCIWTMDSGEPLHTLHDSVSTINTLAFADDQTLAGGADDHMIYVWNARSGQLLRVLRGHDDIVRSIAFFSQGTLLASGSADQTIRVWDARTGQMQQTLQGYINAIWSIAFTPDGTQLAVGSDGEAIRLWDMTTVIEPDAVQRPQSFHGHTGDVRAVAFSPNGRLLASGGVDSTVRLWVPTAPAANRDGQEQPPSLILRGHSGAVRTVAWSPDGALLASAGLDQTILFWDVTPLMASHESMFSGRSTIRNRLRGHEGAIWRLVFHPGGNVLASAGEDQTIRLWDIADIAAMDMVEPSRTLHGHTNTIRALAFSASGRFLASAGQDQTVRLWDLAENEVRHVLQGHTHNISDVVFSPDSTLLASASSDSSVRLWDLESGEVCHILQGHDLWVRSVAFSPDGALLASGGADETIRFWNVETGHCLQTLCAPGPYAGMIITGVTGITPAQRSSLKALGAVELSWGG